MGMVPDESLRRTPEKNSAPWRTAVLLLRSAPGTGSEFTVAASGGRSTIRQVATFLGEGMNYEEKLIQLNQHQIYAREYSGEEPTIILMHGFPDNLHLYDRLIPHLSPPRRIVTFDFLGWGDSDKPTGYPWIISSVRAISCAKCSTLRPNGWAPTGGTVNSYDAHVQVAGKSNQSSVLKQLDN